MAYLVGTPVNVIPIGGVVPLTSPLLNTAPGTKLSLVTVGGGNGVQIADTGFYQVTFGVAPKLPLLTLAGAFQLKVNGVNTVPNTVEFGLIASVSALYSETVIVNVTVNPSTLTLVNESSTAVSLQNITGTAGGGPGAYITILKLQ